MLLVRCLSNGRSVGNLSSSLHADSTKRDVAAAASASAAHAVAIPAIRAPPASTATAAAAARASHP